MSWRRTVTVVVAVMVVMIDDSCSDDSRNVGKKGLRDSRELKFFFSAVDSIR